MKVQVEVPVERGECPEAMVGYPRLIMRSSPHHLGWVQVEIGDVKIDVKRAELERALAAFSL